MRKLRELSKKCIVCNRAYGYYKIVDRNKIIVGLCVYCYAELTNCRGIARQFPSFAEIRDELTVSEVQLDEP